jgi:hypothetical protein
MAVLFRFLQTAAGYLVIAVAPMAVGGFFGNVAEPLSCVTCFLVGMALGFFQGADLDNTAAVIAVGMALLFRKGTGENSIQAIFCMEVGQRFFTLANHLLEHTGLPMFMLIDSAECFSGHCNTGKLQTPENCGNHQKGQKPLQPVKIAADRAAFIHL